MGNNYYDHRVTGKEELVEQFQQSSPDTKLYLNPSGEPSMQAHWPHVFDELSAFSMKHPKEVFLLERWGPDMDEHYGTYFKNGYIQHVKPIVNFSKWNSMYATKFEPRI